MYYMYIFKLQTSMSVLLRILTTVAKSAATTMVALSVNVGLGMNWLKMESLAMVGQFSIQILA